MTNTIKIPSNTNKDRIINALYIAAEEARKENRPHTCKAYSELANWIDENNDYED